MTQDTPIECVWTGEVFQPTSLYQVRRADKQFAKGEILRIVHEPERSHNSHAHYFATVNEAWRNLPPLMAERFPSPDHLRKWALIKAGYCNTHSMPCSSATEARRLAAFIRPMDEFSVVTVERSMVTMYTSQSQSYRSMDKKTFQESKDKVLEVLAVEIGVAKQELSDAGKAA
ncbi:MAG TPA: hypothetical protein VF443_10300 [Nitrospira sp.]